MYTLKEKLAHPNNFGGRRALSDIKYIVIHYTANDGDSDENNATYFQNHDVSASAHYFVDDNSITRSVLDEFVAFSVGGARYSNTKGAKYYGRCINHNSISVELCDNVKNGIYDFTPNTINNAVELVKDLMRKYNIPVSNVIRHYDVTGKICPKPFVDDEKAWLKFKERLVENMDKRTQQEVKVYNWTLECPKWAIPTVQKLLDKHYLEGDDEGKLRLTEDMLRILVINDRAKLYD